MATHSMGDSITKTVSLDKLMAAESELRFRRLGFRSYSAYVQSLIRKDLAAGGALVIHEESAELNDAPSSSARAEKCERRGRAHALRVVRYHKTRSKKKPA